MVVTVHIDEINQSSNVSSWHAADKHLTLKVC